MFNICINIFASQRLSVQDQRVVLTNKSSHTLTIPPALGLGIPQSRVMIVFHRDAAHYTSIQSGFKILHIILLIIT